MTVQLDSTLSSHGHTVLELSNISTVTEGAEHEVSVNESLAEPQGLVNAPINEVEPQGAVNESNNEGEAQGPVSSRTRSKQLK